MINSARDTDGYYYFTGNCYIMVAKTSYTQKKANLFGRVLLFENSSVIL